MLLLLLAMPVALLLMVCMLGGYERLIVEPMPVADEAGAALEPRPVTRAATVAGELGSDLAPEAA